MLTNDSPTVPQPFVDRLSVTDGTTSRVFEGARDSFDWPLVPLDAELTRMIVSRESATDFPDSYLWSGGGSMENLTNNVDPFPAVTAARRIDFELRTSPALVAVATLLILACSSSSRSSSGLSSQSNARNRGAMISAEELATTPELDAYDAVRRLRPMWLRTRGPVSLTGQGRAGIRVYVNGSRRGELQTLRAFRATNIESITYLSAPEATTRFGVDHSDGAIMVLLKVGDT